MTSRPRYIENGREPSPPSGEYSGGGNERVREREGSTDGKRRMRRIEVRKLSVSELEENVDVAAIERVSEIERERERVDTCLVVNLVSE